MSYMTITYKTKPARCLGCLPAVARCLKGIEETDQFKVQIPLRTSRGTAGAAVVLEFFEIHSKWRYNMVMWFTING